MHKPYGFAHYTAAAAWREDGACLHFVCIWVLNVAAFFSALPAFAPGLLAVDAPAPDDLHQRIAGEGKGSAHDEYAEGQRLAELERPAAGRIGASSGWPNWSVQRPASAQKPGSPSAGITNSA